MRKIPTVTALVLACVFGILPSTSALADSVNAEYPTQVQMMHIADDVLEAVTLVQTAQVDIRENRIEDAKASVEDATRALAKADAYIGWFGINGLRTSNPNVEYLPFNVAINVSEAFAETDENMLTLQRAYELFESGDPDNAIELLHASEISVLVSISLIPAEQSTMHLQDAAARLFQEKYFEAAHALKAIEDAVVIDTFEIDSTPR